MLETKTTEKNSENLTKTIEWQAYPKYALSFENFAKMGHPSSQFGFENPKIDGPFELLKVH